MDLDGSSTVGPPWDELGYTSTIPNLLIFVTWQRVIGRYRLRWGIAATLLPVPNRDAARTTNVAFSNTRHHHSRSTITSGSHRPRYFAGSVSTISAVRSIKMTLCMLETTNWSRLGSTE